MKICTRIGVFRMISTYATVSWLTTGMRRARAAPRTSPITNDPAIATRETLIVFTRPSRSSRQFSDTNAHRSYTASVIGRDGRWPRRRSHRPVSSGYGHTVSMLGSEGDLYWKLLFGRKTFLENDATNRGAMLFLMI